MGADNPQRLVKKPTVAELLEDGQWDPGAYRSDTMMVVHIPADRKTAYVVSVPRDSYVPIYDAEGEQHGKNKINAAFAEYGPFGTWRTIENLSGVHIDHMAVIDYAGFNELTEAIGGVDVFVPQTVYDSAQDQEWTQGWHHVEGELALKYVRMRHGLLGGDFDRIDRQQNFLRAVLQKTLSDGTIGNPVKLSKVLGAITGHLAVDGDWSTKDLRNLALSLRGLNSKNVRFMTLPLASLRGHPRRRQLQHHRRAGRQGALEGRARRQGRPVPQEPPRRRAPRPQGRQLTAAGRGGRAGARHETR